MSDLSRYKAKTRESYPTKAAKPGQATVEFALVIVVLMLLLYGIIEVSRLIFINAEIDNAAREGARYAAIVPGASHDGLITTVDGKLTLADRSAVSVQGPNYPSSGGLRCTFCPVTVTVTYQWTSLVPFLRLGPLTLHSTATRLIETNN
jgi:Flp pilus assembly protein TadG